LRLRSPTGARRGALTLDPAMAELQPQSFQWGFSHWHAEVVRTARAGGTTSELAPHALSRWSGPRNREGWREECPMLAAPLDFRPMGKNGIKGSSGSGASLFNPILYG
jgi:hypothetical protein